MVAQNRGLIADTGKHALPAARETSKEMGLNKAFGDQQIRLHRYPVNDQRCAGGQNTDLHIAICVKRIVHNNALGICDLLTQLGNQLFFRSQTVETGGHQQGNCDIGIASAQRSKHGRQNIPAGYRAGMVGNNDGAGFLILCQLFQAGATDRGCHSLFYQFQTGFFTF